MGTKKKYRHNKKNRSYKKGGGAGEDDIIPAIVAALDPHKEATRITEERLNNQNTTLKQDVEAGARRGHYITGKPFTHEHTYVPHIFEIADLIGTEITEPTKTDLIKFYKKYEDEFAAFMNTFNRTQSGGYPNLKDYIPYSSSTSESALDSRSASERLRQKIIPKRIRTGDTPPTLTPEREIFLIDFFKLSTFDLKEVFEHANIDQHLIDEFFTKYMKEYFRMLNANRNNLFNYSEFYKLIATTLIDIFTKKFPTANTTNSLLFNSQNKKIRGYIIFCYKDIISIENAIIGKTDDNARKQAVKALLLKRYETQVEGTVTSTVEGDNESLKFALNHIFGVETSLKAREKIKAIDLIIDSITITNFEEELKKIIELMNTTNTKITTETITHTLPAEILNALKDAKKEAESKAIQGSATGATEGT